MLKIRSKLILGLAFIISLFNSNSVIAVNNNHYSITTQSQKGDKEFKYGQYVFVTLKDGSQTVGKIAGKKSSKKYYVNQLDGGLDLSM